MNILGLKLLFATVLQSPSATQTSLNFLDYCNLLKTPINAKTLTIKGKTFRRKVEDDEEYFDLVSPAPKCTLSDLGNQAWTVTIVMTGLIDLQSASKKFGIETATWEEFIVSNMYKPDLREVQMVSYDAPGLPKGYRARYSTIDGKETYLVIEKGSKRNKPVEPPFELPQPRFVPEFQLGAQGSFSKSGNIYEFKVDKAGSEVYSAQLFWEYPASCTGRKYKISFDIQALRPAKVEIVVVQGDRPFSNLGLKETISVNEEWKRVTYNVTVPKDSKVLRLPCLMAGLTPNIYSVRALSVKVDN